MIVSEPTEEAREAGQKSKEMAQRHIKRMQFWERLLNKIKEKKIKLHSNISPSKYSWIGTGAGKSGLGFNYTVTYDSAGIELYIDRGKDSKEINKEIFDQLYKNKEKIEKLFGGKLNWERLDNRRACRISKRYNIGLRNEEEWDGLQDKMISDMQKLEVALKDFIKKLKI